MQETRRARLASLMQQELSHLISREVKDPRIPALTITSVEVTQDASQATIFVAPLGGWNSSRRPIETELSPEKIDDETGDEMAAGTSEPVVADELAERAARQKAKDCMEGLRSASGLMKRHLSRILTVRQVPALIFKEDKGLQNANRVFDLLKQIGTGSGK